MIPKRVAVEDGAGGTPFPLDQICTIHAAYLISCPARVQSGSEISKGRNDTGTVYNCALINSGLSPLFHFRVFNHLPKHCLNIILVKYKCEKLHDLFI